jgi:hypothetical protein
MHESIVLAAVNGKTRQKTTVRVVDASCQPATQDPTGSVLAGYLQIIGQVLEDGQNHFILWRIPYGEGEHDYRCDTLAYGMQVKKSKRVPGTYEHRNVANAVGA